MYLRLVQFTLAENARGRAQTIADDLIPAIKQLAGCQSAGFFGGGEDGDCGLVVFWDTQEHADEAAGVIGPKLEAHLAGNVTAPPNRRLFPVLAQ